MPPEPMYEPSQPADEASNSDLPQQQRFVRSEDILQGENEVLIIHGGIVYRLRQTKSGKLILNK